MTDPEDTIRALERALERSPNNVPLLRHLGDVLRAGGRLRDAEVRYREALGIDPDDDEVRLALADCYLSRGKRSHAGVILDLLVARPDPAPETYLMLARLRMCEGDVRGASSSFRRAVEADPRLLECELATRLGFAAPTPRGDDEVEETEEEDEVEFEEYEEVAREGLGTDGRAVHLEVEQPTERFGDVGGLESVKHELSLKTMHALQHPDLFAAYGKSVGGSVLLWGPPGCGKATVARAVAGESGMSFMHVASHTVLETWLGQSERNLHGVFQMARVHAPCVLYFQGVEALAGRGSEANAVAARRLRDQFLSELSGSVDDNSGVLVVASTQAPWEFEQVLTGAFDRTLFVGPPDVDARAQILDVLLRRRPCDELDTAQLAAKARGFSGVDLVNAVEHAIENKLAEAIESGSPQPLAQRDLLCAIADLDGSVPLWFERTRTEGAINRARFWYPTVEQLWSA